MTGRTGRPPLPTELKILNGNPGQRPLNDAEPKYELKIPKFPPDLAEEATKEYKRIGKLLHSTRILTEVDLAALSAYAVNWARWLDAERRIVQKGVVIDIVGPGGILYTGLNPYLKVAEKALAAMRGSMSDFGLTPSARVRLKSPVEKQESPLDKKMFG